MSNVDFSSILNVKASEVEAPAQFPVGSYTMTVVGNAMGTSEKKNTPYIEFELKVVCPMEDVDQAEYAKVKDPQTRSLKTKFFLTPDSLFRLKQFAEACGADVASERTMAEIIPELTGAEVIGIIKKELAQDGSGREFTRLNTFMKI